MANTKYIRPEISQESDRPIPLANQGYPYNGISSDRRFEELIYSIYKKKIEHNTEWKGMYDDIALMQGVGEQGRDCVLFKNQMATGAIQCKKYEDRISKPDCAKEILKFILYSFIDSGVLPDANNFTYYFVVSGGFSGPAAEFLDAFNQQIVQESELEKWFTELKNKYKASLGGLDYNTIQSELKAKLAAIKVKQVIPQDLDIELATAYSLEIIPLFFDVRTVTDNTYIEKLNTLIEKNLFETDDLQISDESILKQFQTASLQLSSYRDDLHNIKDSHIQRNETADILNWIETPLKKDQAPILIVAGNQGYGKTVIMKDVYSALRKKDLPVIAIKADRYYAESVKELTNKLNLEHPLIKLLLKLTKTFSKPVVIIDQIDSLSQSITSRRDYIDIYNQLIHQLQFISGIRILISIRTFDLDYDFEFSSYRQLQKVIVKPLSVEQVKSVLAKLFVPTNELPKNLIELLSVPNHLDIFCKIYRPGLIINHLQSLQDLYNQLWLQHITSQKEGDRYSKALYEIADKMYLHQQLASQETQLTDVNRNSLPYLISNGLLVDANKNIQFFHQSFYDYVLARSFTEQRKQLIKFIQAEEQSLFIRPAVKMILTFIRQRDMSEYLQLLRSILFSKKIRYHIQLLAINQLGFEENPSKSEIDFIRNLILKSKRWKMPFIESAVGKNWLPLLMEANVIDQLLHPARTLGEKVRSNKTFQSVSQALGYSVGQALIGYAQQREKQLNLWSWILRRSLPENRTIVLAYLEKLPASEERNFRVLRFLWQLKIWDQPNAFALFESCTVNPVKNWYDALHILEDTLDYNFKWSLQQINRFLTHTESIQSGHADMYEHQMENCLKKMFKLDAEASFEFAIRLTKDKISDSIQKYEIGTDEFYTDAVYDLYDYQADHSHDTPELLLKLIFEHVVLLALDQSPVFKKFVIDHQDEYSTTILKILLTGLASSPGDNIDISYKLIMRLLNHKAYDHGLKYWLGNLLQSLYIFLNREQKSALVTLLLSVCSEYDYYIQKNGPERKFQSSYGRTRFELLSMIPMDEINKEPLLKKHFQELQRRFGTAVIRKPHAMRIQRVGAPLAEKAYEKMDLLQWENSFLEFSTDEYDRIHSDRGGLTENYRKFEEQIQTNVPFFLPLIEKIIRENKVVPDYMLAGISGLVKAKFDPELVKNLVKQLIQMPLKGFHTRQLVWDIGYLINNRLVDEDIIDYLVRIAINDPHPVESLNPDHPHYDMLNTNRGSAVHALVTCFQQKEYGNKIFDALEKTVIDPVISVRIAAMMDLAVLMNIDKAKTLSLFLNLTSDPNHHIFKASVNSAQYLARYDFEALIPYFEAGIQMADVQEHLATILAIAWLNNEDKSYPLLEKVWKISDKAKAKIVEVGLENFISADDKTKGKCKQLYTMFLDVDAKEVIQEYNTSFLHMSPLHFNEFLPLITVYSNSPAAAREPHYFYEYLIKCSKKFPVEVIDLLRNYRNYDEPNVGTGPYYSSDDPVKAVVGAYNGLYEQSPLNKKYVRKALDLFDEMLKQQLFRLEAQKVLNVV
jgi:hypothetical protein